VYADLGDADDMIEKSKEIASRLHPKLNDMFVPVSSRNGGDELFFHVDIAIEVHPVTKGLSFVSDGVKAARALTKAMAVLEDSSPESTPTTSPRHPRCKYADVSETVRLTTIVALMTGLAGVRCYSQNPTERKSSLTAQ